MEEQTNFLKISSDVQLAVRILNPEASGYRPTLVFLHYWGGSDRTFHHLFDLLSRYRIIAPTSRGWGGSIGPVDDDAYTISHLADDLLEIVARLQLAEGSGFVLVGHGMGAKVAQLAAATQPRGLKGIILVAPAPLLSVELPQDKKEEQLNAYKSAESIEAYALNVLSAEGRLSQEDLQVVIEDSANGSNFATQAWPEYAMAEDYQSEMEKIACPVKIVAGELDKVHIQSHVNEDMFRKLNPPKEMVVLSGCGHLIPFEDPTALTMEIQSFCTRFETANGQ